MDVITFSPLFIGAMVATFSAEFGGVFRWFFQSPFHRGNGCYIFTGTLGEVKLDAFSPLFIGAMVATAHQKYVAVVFGSFSPLFIGAMVATRYRVRQV